MMCDDNSGEDLDEVQTALDEALAQCAHISVDTFFEGMAEFIGAMVKRGELGHEQVYQYLEHALPPRSPPAEIDWRDM